MRQSAGQKKLTKGTGNSTLLLKNTLLYPSGDVEFDSIN